MIYDPIIEEIRQIPLAIEAECQHDEQLQETYRERLVRRSPKPAIVPPKTNY